MTKVYALFYDHDDTGAREEWNTFYTPCEVFATPADRATRQAALKAADPDLEFHEVDLEIPPSAAVTAMGSGPNPGGSGNTGINDYGINDDDADDDDADAPELTEEEKEQLQKAQLEAMMPKPTYHGAPETLDAAIERILELELRLGDLHRAAEIAVAVRDFTLMEGQMPEAEKALETKIVVEYPDNGGPNIVVYS